MGIDRENRLIVILLGIAATIPYEIYTRLMVSFGFGKYSVYQLSSLVVTLNRPTAGIGIVTSSIVGGTIAIFLYQALKKTGPDYIVVKGLVASTFGWGVTEFIYTWLIESRNLAFRPVSDYYLELSGSVIFGLFLGLLFQWFIVPYLKKI